MSDTKFCIGILIFIVVFFSVIAHNVVEHSKYLKDFDRACVAAGGHTYIPKGVKGHAKPECRPQPNIEIKLEGL